MLVNVIWTSVGNYGATSKYYFKPPMEGLIQWPPWLPDLSALEFYLWNSLKNQIDKQRYDNVDDLKVTFRTVQRVSEKG